MLRPVQRNPLLRLPAAGDNAVMEIEPITAEPPKPKRRWFQFSLRAVMILIVVLVVALGIILPAFQGAKESGPRHPLGEPVAGQK